jgi:trans-2,3-dihydro-3-hydroxyanthranilate isomerase
MEATVIPGSIPWLEGPQPLHEYLVVDVFTPHPLQGNQLGVFLDARRFGSELMLALAREMKFSETVFLLPSESDADVRVRIFTPGGELPFAGHPVLGTAVVVATALGSDSVVLQTGVGEVPVALERRHGEIVFGRMRQPVPTPEPYDREAELLSALGIESSLLPIELYRQGPLHVYVALPGEPAVADLRPDMHALGALGVCVSCFAGQGRSWTTRMFAPATGVPEDAATGSAAGPLALHLARHGRIAFGQEIEIHQGAAIDRPSVLFANVTGSPERIESIEVGGSAQIVAHGHFRIGKWTASAEPE